jgi:hypothetical protein
MRVRVARSWHYDDSLEPKPEQLAQSLRAAVGGPYDGEAIQELVGKQRSVTGGAQPVAALIVGSADPLHDFAVLHRQDLARRFTVTGLVQASDSGNRTCSIRVKLLQNG